MTLYEIIQYLFGIRGKLTKVCIPENGSREWAGSLMLKAGGGVLNMSGGFTQGMG